MALEGRTHDAVNTTRWRGHGIENRHIKLIAGGTYVLDPDEAMYGIIDLEGTLTADVVIEFPPVDGMVYIVRNCDCVTGNFTITLQPIGGTGFILSQGKWALIADLGGTIEFVAGSDGIAGGAPSLGASPLISLTGAGGALTLSYLQVSQSPYLLFTGATQNNTVTFPATRAVRAGEVMLAENGSTQFTITLLADGDGGSGVVVQPRSITVFTADGTGNLISLFTLDNQNLFTGVTTQRGMTSVTCTAGGTITASTITASAAILKLIGTPAAAFNLVLPTVAGLRWTIWNATAQVATVKTAAGVGVTVAAGQTQVLLGDGADLLEQDAAGRFSQMTSITGITGDVTLTQAQARKGIINLQGTPGAPFNVIVPNGVATYLINNATNDTANVKTAAGSSSGVLTGLNKMVFIDSSGNSGLVG